MTRKIYFINIIIFMVTCLKFVYSDFIDINQMTSDRLLWFIKSKKIIFQKDHNPNESLIDNIVVDR
jgi:hypothetical protein